MKFICEGNILRGRRREVINYFDDASVHLRYCISIRSYSIFSYRDFVNQVPRMLHNELLATAYLM